MDLDSPKFKVNITSFIVPELSIDLPETATVANLKARHAIYMYFANRRHILSLLLVLE